LVSTDLAKQHSSTLAELMTGSTTPPALLLQAVDTAGRLIVARPAESSLLVQHLEQLLLSALTAPGHTSGTAAATTITAATSRGVAILVETAAIRRTNNSCGSLKDGHRSCAAHGQQQQPAAATAAAQKAAAVAVSAVPAAESAVRWYCRLLLSEKLLLTGYSWGVVAEGLLASGPLQVCAVLRCAQLSGCVMCLELF
jgi:hypothetical protein